MINPGDAIVLYPRNPQWLTLDELASATSLHPALVLRFVEFGLLEPVAQAGRSPFFEAAAVPRLRMIQRLRHDLGVNLSGVAVILDLTERLRALQQEVDRLRNFLYG